MPAKDNQGILGYRGLLVFRGLNEYINIRLGRYISEKGVKITK